MSCVPLDARRRYRALLAQWVDDQITDREFIEAASRMKLFDEACAVVMDSLPNPDEQRIARKTHHAYWR